MREINLKKIVIDSREKHLIEYFKTRQEKVVEIEVKKLDIGDIIISDELCIERKEGFDYVKSLIDNRLFEQILRLKETYSAPLIIIEGLNRFVFDNVKVKKSSIYGSLVKISYGLQIPVIFTLNLEDTVLVIERLTLQENSYTPESPLIPHKAPKKLNKDERRIYIIESLIDCGNKKARILIEHFKTPFEVIMAIKETEVLFTKSGKPKGISGPLEQIKGFGYRFIESNRELLFDFEQNLRI